MRCLQPAWRTKRRVATSTFGYQKTFLNMEHPSGTSHVAAASRGSFVSQHLHQHSVSASVQADWHSGFISSARRLQGPSTTPPSFTSVARLHPCKPASFDGVLPPEPVSRCLQVVLCLPLDIACGI